MKPSQVLDVQGDLLARMGDPRFREYVRLVLSGGQDLHGLLDDETAHNNSMNLTANLATYAKMAEAYHVSEDMCRMVQHAAALLDDTDTFAPDLAPSEYGFVHFAEPLPIMDVRGRTMLAHYLVWGKSIAGLRSKHGFTLTQVPSTTAHWFNDHHLGIDEIGRALMETAQNPQMLMDICGRWGMIGADTFEVGKKVGQPMIGVDDEIADIIREQGDTPHEFTNPLRYLHALWMLLSQTVTTVRPECVDKMTMKRAKRSGIPPRVTVIELRRAEGARNGNESGIEWSHRWLVRGHMRWQPYGSGAGCPGHVLGPVEVEMGHSVRACTQPGCDHMVKRIFIAPYVKGPEGKTLRFTKHVYSLNR